MQIVQGSLNHSRDQGYFVLEQGCSTNEAFLEMEMKLSKLEHVQSQSGEDDWTDFTFDKFFTSLEAIRTFYKENK